MIMLPKLQGYRTRTYHKDDYLHLDASYPEYAASARKVIDRYVETYNLNPDDIGVFEEFFVRKWLHILDATLKEQGTEIPEDVTDYYIKSRLDIIPKDREYEKACGSFLAHLYSGFSSSKND